MATVTRFAPGDAVHTTAVIFRKSTNIRIQNPDKFTSPLLPMGTLGRLHSHDGRADVFTVWFLDETTMNTIIADLPRVMVGLLLEHHEHGIFPHLKAGAR